MNFIDGSDLNCGSYKGVSSPTPYLATLCAGSCTTNNQINHNYIIWPLRWDENYILAKSTSSDLLLDSVVTSVRPQVHPVCYQHLKFK